MRAVAIAIASLLPAFGAHGVQPEIRLDRPGALEALAIGNPDHYRRVSGILAAAREMPCGRDVMAALRVRFDAQRADCSAMVMTSFPAKRRISFRLDDTPYVAVVQLRLNESFAWRPKSPWR